MADLFPVDKVKKFFEILDRLSGSYPIDLTNYPWKNYQTIYTKDSKHTPCTREVFVHRTINKWLKGKALIIYRESELGVEYKQYVSITSLSYYNDWSGGHINVGLLDYAQPYNPTLFTGEKFKHNDVIHLEGEWCDDLTLHTQLLTMVTMENVPEKEYIFKAYDWSKYPKRVKKGQDPKELIETTVSIKAKTLNAAYKEKNKLKTALIIGDLIEIKE